MFWPLHNHHQEGCIQGNTNAANSVEDVHVCTKNKILSIKIAMNVYNTNQLQQYCIS
jgi:hypothetical protein